MPLLVLVIAILALAAIAIAAAGREERLQRDTDGDAGSPAGGVPLGFPPEDEPLARSDLETVRFALAFRGYRTDEVDAVLDRVAADIAARDERIGELTDQVRALSSAPTASDPLVKDDPRAE